MCPNKARINKVIPVIKKNRSVKFGNTRERDFSKQNNVTIFKVAIKIGEINFNILMIKFCEDF